MSAAEQRQKAIATGYNAEAQRVVAAIKEASEKGSFEVILNTLSDRVASLLTERGFALSENVDGKRTKISWY